MKSLESPSEINPQNPFQSVLVSASAGCGKTYQLAQRFLCLIAAGADPAKILTVTFTKKAAAEMQSRIIEDALKLVHDPRAASEFDEKMAKFHVLAKNATAPPLPAKTVGMQILLNTQRLAINTIDGIFWQWTQRFPVEGSLPLNKADQWEGEAKLPVLFTLTNADLEETIADEAWDKALQEINQSDAALLGNLLNYFDLDLFHLRNTVNRLTEHASFCWHLDVKGFPSYQRWSTLREANGLIDEVLLNDAHRRAFASLLQSTTSPEGKQGILAFLEQWNTTSRSPTCESLQNSGILTKEGRISGTILRGSKRDSLRQEVECIEELTHKVANLEKFARFDLYGSALFTLTQMFSRHQRMSRHGRGVITFDDLSRAAFRLFKNPDTAAVRMQILRGIDHLLLDEFQDTSRLQWEVFSEIGRELLAAEPNGDAVKPSIFIVGDIKQSVYGFREADPQVMETAKNDLMPFGLKPVGLDHSFRSSNVILKYINQIFQSADAEDYGAAVTARLREFRPHQTAASPDDKYLPIVPDFGSISLAPLFTASKNELESLTNPVPLEERPPLPALDDENRNGHDSEAGEVPLDLVSLQVEQRAVEKEADYLAQHLLYALGPESPHRVFEKKTKQLRALTPKDCVVLYRNKTNAEVFARALRKVGIATQRIEEVGFFQRQEIVDLMALLRWLVMPADALSLATVLRSPMFAVSDKNLFSAFASDSEKPFQPQDPLRSLGLEADGGFRIGLTRHSMRFGTFETLSSLLATIMEKQALGKRLRQAWGHEEGSQAEANAFYFLDMLRGQEISGTGGPFHLLAEMERLAAENQVGNIPVSSNAVTLMTLHKSKGLEFPYVAIVETASSWMKQDPEWLRFNDGTAEPDLRYIGKKKQRPVGDAMFDETLAVNFKGMLEECFRLLYVGLTRAKHHLYLSGHQPAKALTSGQPSFYELLKMHLENLPGSTTREFLGTSLCEFVRLPMETGYFSQPTSKATDLYENRPTASTEPPSSFATTETTPSPETPPPLYFRIAHRAELSTPDLSLGKLRTARSHADSRAFRGTFWHKCFELLCRETPAQLLSEGVHNLNLQEIWQQLARHSRGGQVWENDLQLFEESRHVFLKASSSAAWQDIIKQSTALLPELPVIHLKDAELVSGQMDLVVHKPGEIWVVDFKGSEIEYVSEDLRLPTGEIRPEDLRLFSQDQGYDRQVRDYMDAAASLYRGKKVRGFLFFIVSRQLLEVTAKAQN